MPFKSEAQRKFMWAKHLEIAKRWEKETPRKSLPKKALKTIRTHGVRIRLGE